MAGKVVKISHYFNPTKLQKEILSVVDSQKVRYEINKIIAKYINKYVPLRTGTLRSKVVIGPTTISWSAPWARYQYYGKIYGPNYKIPVDKVKGTEIRDGEGSDGFIFRSPKGVTKFATNRDLRYHTPGTGKFWIKKAFEDSSNRRAMMLAITNYLKKELSNK